MASVTYGKDIMAKILWQMKLSHLGSRVRFEEEETRLDWRRGLDWRCKASNRVKLEVKGGDHS